MISTAEIDQLEEKCRENGVTAIAAGVSEFNLDRGLELSQRLDLPWFCSAEAWHYSRHKADFKRLCRKAGVRIAKDYALTLPPDPAKLDEIEFPIVIKPVDSNGNFGMSYCYAPEDVEPALKQAFAYTEDPEVVAEKMLKGNDYLAHYAIAQGKARLTDLMISFSQPGYPANCYCFSTTYVSELDRYLQQVHPNFLRLLEMIGCRDGVAWIEMILDEDGQFYALEMAERPSGQLIAIPQKQTTGFDTFKWLMEAETGIEHTPDMLPAEIHEPTTCFSNSYILWNDRDAEIAKIEGLDYLQSMDGISFRSLIYVGDQIEHNRYMIVIVFTSENTDQMISTIKAINEHVHVYDTEGNDIVIHFDDFAQLEQITQLRKAGKKA